MRKIGAFIWCQKLHFVGWIKSVNLKNETRVIVIGSCTFIAGSPQCSLLLLEKFLRCMQTLCVALRTARNSPVHSNGVINYAIAIRLFQTVMRDCLKNFSSSNILFCIWNTVNRAVCPIFFISPDISTFSSRQWGHKTLFKHVCCLLSKFQLNSGAGPPNYVCIKLNSFWCDVLFLSSLWIKWSTRTIMFANFMCILYFVISLALFVWI